MTISHPYCLHIAISLYQIGNIKWPIWSAWSHKTTVSGSTQLSFVPTKALLIMLHCLNSSLEFFALPLGSKTVYEISRRTFCPTQTEVDRNLIVLIARSKFEFQIFLSLGCFTAAMTFWTLLPNIWKSILAWSAFSFGVHTFKISSGPFLKY